MKLKWTVGDWVAFKCEPWEVEEVYNDGTVRITNYLLQVYLSQKADDVYPLTLATRTILTIFFRERDRIPEVYGLNWPDIDVRLCKLFDRACSAKTPVGLVCALDDLKEFVSEINRVFFAYPESPKMDAFGIKVFR